MLRIKSEESKDEIVELRMTGKGVGVFIGDLGVLYLDDDGEMRVYENCSNESHTSRWKK